MAKKKVARATADSTSPAFSRWKQVDVEDVTGFPPARLLPTMHPHFDYLERVTLLRAAATWARVPVESAVDIMERLRVALQDAHERLEQSPRDAEAKQEELDVALHRVERLEEQVKEIFDAFACDTLKDLEAEVEKVVAGRVEAVKETLKAERHDEVEILRARIKGQDDAVIRLVEKLNDANVALVTAEKSRDKAIVAAVDNAGIVTAQIQTADDDCVIKEKLTRRIEGLEKALAAAEKARDTARAAQVEACRESAQNREFAEAARARLILVDKSRVRMKQLDEEAFEAERVELQRKLANSIAYGEERALRAEQLLDVEPLATAFAYLAAKHGSGLLSFSSDDDGSIRKALDLLRVK